MVSMVKSVSGINYANQSKATSYYCKVKLEEEEEEEEEGKKEETEVKLGKRLREKFYFKFG